MEKCNCKSDPEGHCPIHSDDIEIGQSLYQKLVEENKHHLIEKIILRSN